MKPSFRRYRRRVKPSTNEGAFFKKEGKTESAFFGDASQQAFFQPAGASQAIQRKCDDCEKEEKVQRTADKKEEEKKVQRAANKKEEDDKKLMRAADKKEEEKELQKGAKKKEEEDKKLQKKEAGGSVASTATISTYVGSLNGKGNSLSPVTNEFFSSRMGYDFSNVKLHTDNDAAESAKSVNAKAYTIGNDIVFNEGQLNTESIEGKTLLAHELTHVIQNNGLEQTD